MLFWLEMFSFSGWKCNLQRWKLDHWKWTGSKDRDLAGVWSLRASSIRHCHMREKNNQAVTRGEQISCAQVRMREIQGAIAVSAIFQMILGYAGLIGFLLRSISIYDFQFQLNSAMLISLHSFSGQFPTFVQLFLHPSLIITRWITPLTITPAVAMIGISLFDAASYYSQGNWGIAIL